MNFLLDLSSLGARVSSPFKVGILIKFRLDSIYILVNMDMNYRNILFGCLIAACPHLLIWLHVGVSYYCKIVQQFGRRLEKCDIPHLSTCFIPSIRIQRKC